MKQALKIILGLILIVVPLYFIFPGMALESWGIATLNLIKGGITLIIFLTGLILIILGISELKN